MYTTQNDRQRESNIDREEEEKVSTDRSTQLRKIDREEVKVGTDRCIQLRTIDRERDTQIERRRRRQVQIDVHNIEQQKERQSDREEEEEEVGTDRCIQHRTKDREILRQRGEGGCSYRYMYTTQNNR